MVLGAPRADGASLVPEIKEPMLGTKGGGVSLTDRLIPVSTPG